MAIRIKKKKFKGKKAYVPSELEEEIRWRINVALWAYAYECKDAPIVPDFKFDETCLKIDPDFPTGNKKLDKFFKEEFDPCTGSWVYNHPELNKIKALYERLKSLTFQQ